MIRVVSRKSQLAKIQAEMVITELKRYYPDEEFKLLPISIEADERKTERTKHKDVFVKELEEALLSGFADIAVHSLKDMSVGEKEPLVIGAVLPRKESRDVLVSIEYPDLNSMPQGALIGTSSLRRGAQLAMLYPKLQVLPCHGNVDTRIAKLEKGEYDGLILSGAGLERMGWTDAIAEYLPIDTMVPCSSQGAIAVECRREDIDMREKLAKINDKKTRQITDLERRIVKELGASCDTPLGVHAEFMDGSKMQVTALISYADGEGVIKEKGIIQLENDNYDEIDIQKFLKKMMAQGADQIVDFYSSMR